MTNMTEYDSWNILKWVLIVLAAGFVGQFGKTLAQYLMRRAKEKAARTARKPAGGAGEAGAAPAVPARIPGTETTVEAAKPQAGEAGPSQAMAQGATAEENRADAKAAKALAKAKKKEAKLLKKLFK